MTDLWTLSFIVHHVCSDSRLGGRVLDSLQSLTKVLQVENSGHFFIFCNSDDNQEKMGFLKMDNFVVHLD